jgi:hypothetical protein
MMEWQQQQHELQLQSADRSTSTDLFSFASSSDSQVRRVPGCFLLRLCLSMTSYAHNTSLAVLLNTRRSQ